MWGTATMKSKAFALDMGQKPKDEAAKGASILSRKKVCARGIGGRDAAAKSTLLVPGKESRR